MTVQRHKKVNLDALARYTRKRGGWSLSSPYMEGFKCQALAFGMEEGDLQETRFAFEDSTQVRHSAAQHHAAPYGSAG